MKIFDEQRVLNPDGHTYRQPLHRHGFRIILPLPLSVIKWDSEKNNNSLVYSIQYMYIFIMLRYLFTILHMYVCTYINI